MWVISGAVVVCGFRLLSAEVKGGARRCVDWSMCAFFFFSTHAADGALATA
jgi:hypothetical protein